MSTKDNSMHFSLRVSLSTLLTLFIIIAIVLTGGITYLGTSLFLRERLKRHLSDVISSGVVYVDAERHALLQKPQDEDGQNYRDIKQSLQLLRDRIADARFVYTVRKYPDGKIRFIVDAEEKEADLSHLYDAYEDAGPGLMKILNAPQNSLVEEEFYTDRWGTWLSGYAPVYNSRGGVEAVLCIDISAESIIGYERDYIRTILAIGIAMTLIGSLAGILLAWRIGRSLKLLETDVERIRKFQIEDNVPLRSRITEIINLKEGIDSMKGGLRSFRRYVPADLVANLIGMGKEAIPDAEKRELTVMFTDITDFTSIAERLDQDLLVESLTSYFSELSEIILKNGGTIDKYIGDSIMAFWGAPTRREDHAIAACRTALSVQTIADELNRKFVERGHVPFHTRIGINTGPVSVGNFGYEKRLSYTVIGDHVNLASRAEEINKIYRTDIIITQNTRDQIGDLFVCRKLDRVAVRGKSEGVDVYELLSERGSLDARAGDFLENYNVGLELYERREWRAAEAEFTKAYRLFKEDRPVRMYIKRCRQFAIEPPPADWDGIMFAHHK